ncbi:hypothetical protein [Silvimonas iriomotensis]|uniref:hypothetical protein n=1 Tax=Silvimonas iriomotensis TaxID=449662 RepID=UPI0016636A2C|nr:hypothetical protein [Silvimonas iriomotensis]
MQPDPVHLYIVLLCVVYGFQLVFVFRPLRALLLVMLFFSGQTSDSNLDKFETGFHHLSGNQPAPGWRRYLYWPLAIASLPVFLPLYSPILASLIFVAGACWLKSAPTT